jgi:hypothetical protein
MHTPNTLLYTPAHHDSNTILVENHTLPTTLKPSGQACDNNMTGLAAQFSARTIAVCTRTIPSLDDKKQGPLIKSAKSNL